MSSVQWFSSRKFYEKCRKNSGRTTKRRTYPAAPRDGVSTEMKHGKILLTGGSGTLGSHIIKSGLFKELLTPGRDELDITSYESVEKFFTKNDIESVIHCAALARVSECEQKPAEAIATNTIGTANLVKAVLKKQEQLNIRFVHISTDGVYESTNGNYTERSPTKPYNKYGLTKLGAECAVNLLKNFCIIRTRFFDPEKIKYDTYATDSYNSMITVGELVKAIAILIKSDFIGTINVGGERISDYDAIKKYKPAIKPCKFDDIQSRTSFRLSKDASMNISLWKKLKEEIKA